MLIWNSVFFKWKLTYNEQIIANGCHSQEVWVCLFNMESICLILEFVSHFKYITLEPILICWYEPLELNDDVNRLIYRAVLLNCISFKTVAAQPNKKYSALKIYVSLGFAYLCIDSLFITSFAYACLHICFVFLCTFIIWIWKYMIQYIRQIICWWQSDNA